MHWAVLYNYQSLTENMMNSAVVNAKYTELILADIPIIIDIQYAYKVIIYYHYKKFNR